MALTANADAVADKGISRHLTLHMPATLRIASPAAESLGAAAEILDFALGLAAGPAASWSHTCPWGAEIRLAPRAALQSGVWATQRAIPRREAA